MLNGEELSSLINKYYTKLSATDRRIFKMYVETLKDIKKQMIEHSSKMSANANLNDWYRGDRLAALEKEIEIKIKELMLNVADEVEKTAINTTIKFDKEFAKMLTKAYPEADSFSSLNEEVIKELVNENWLGTDFYERCGHKGINLTYDMKNVLRVGIIQGKSIANIIKDMEVKTGKYYKECEAIVRSEVMHSLNSSVVQQYKNMEADELEHYTCEDERVCKVCNKLHGKTYPIEKAPRLPASTHPNCRCTYLVSEASINRSIERLKK